MRVGINLRDASRELTSATKKRLDANLQLDETTKKLASQTQSLASATRGVVWATWSVVLITLATQTALIYLAATHKCPTGAPICAGWKNMQNNGRSK
jgi:hypothetical protein